VSATNDGTNRSPVGRRRVRAQDGAGTDRPVATTRFERWGRWLRRLSIAAAALINGAAVSIALAAGVSIRHALLLGFSIAAAFALLWCALRLLRRLLWRVGRRLAFTYFLIGVLPIPMAAFLLAVAAYLLGGFLLGHLFRDALAVVEQEVAAAAQTRLEDPASLAGAPARVGDLAFSYYVGGERVAGDERGPLQWPTWLEAGPSPVGVGGAGPSPVGAGGAAPVAAPEAAAAAQVAPAPAVRRQPARPLVALPDGTVSLAVARSRGPSGVVAFYDGPLDARLRTLSGVWIELLPTGDPRADKVMDVTILGQRFIFQPLSRERGSEDRQKFLGGTGHPLSGWPVGDGGIWIHGFDVTGRLLALDTGEELAASLPASLVGTPGRLLPQLFSSSREVDTLAWLTFVVPAFLLFDVFAVAWIMALFMVLGLSRAVNRLSAATTALQHGDFSIRIPVRRTDQIGALQASFNAMAASLEDLIATKAQKETLEKELAMARQLQESLIPKGLQETAEVEFATHFEPSAAIGGDYFDILHVDERRLAIVVADVSGHGLSAGLRMAMIKAALAILVEEEEGPAAILHRLDRLLRRSGQEGPGFVTATLTFLDLAAGRAEIVNAGHPPTYLLRGGSVREIMLPGSPLGALGSHYGSTEVDLMPGDALVWLSDGFIEATDPDGEVFGYDRTVKSLGGSSASPAIVRDRLLDSVARYTEGSAPEDDRTMVVMRFRAATGAVASPRSVASASRSAAS
jgi:sigma-B regulation protein RsbU (phosphoserine phosphatase)